MLSFRKRRRRIPGSFLAKRAMPSPVSPGKCSSKTSTCTFPRTRTRPYHTLVSAAEACDLAVFGACRFRLRCLAPLLTHLFIPFEAWVCSVAFFSLPGRIWFCGSNHRTWR